MLMVMARRIAIDFRKFKIQGTTGSSADNFRSRKTRKEDEGDSSRCQGKMSRWEEQFFDARIVCMKTALHFEFHNKSQLVHSTVTRIF